MPDNKEPVDPLLLPDAPLRPSTRNVVFSILMDTWPNDQARADFGIASQEHLEALERVLKHGDFTPVQLDDALGDGPKITALVAGASHNPHPGIVFATERDRPTEMDRLREAAAGMPKGDPDKDRGR